VTISPTTRRAQETAAKRRRAEQLLREDPFASNIAIAQQVPCGHPLVAHVRAEMKTRRSFPENRPASPIEVDAFRERDIDNLVRDVARLLFFEEENVSLKAEILRLRQRLAQLQETAA
jgi:hypothetical protein